ncbi:protein of unknown function [Streptococcus thermophilus]|uniref:Uncharacterized protein n=1 Tax=Streptococcus thermophilus TaxID=1308 RepID=A0A8D6UB05_STRTR|nr:protein of unknown function [Streptococcus thermophilus]CAD0146926.1 protein of unknown function [Streptococcus thermophilus]CAD0151138.1 protein of unknown function [Streptococcus thermophilus]CAD0153042.1 protein of unknown function [Streptococcus thermophilus]
MNADGTLTGKVSTVILTLVGTFFLVLASFIGIQETFLIV